nr:DUF2586 family protein [uncultured Flavobacterium sp.]
MSLPSIIFQEGQGGLGRPLANNDHISGMLFYTAGSLPSGFASTSTATRCKALYSPEDAIAAGIVKDYSDATAATGTYTVSAYGAAGDTMELLIADIAEATGAAQSTSLGVYTRTSADTTNTLLAASYVAKINSGTATHGYSATNSSAVITITAPKRLGAYLNSGTPISATLTGTIAGSISQFSSGVASRMAQYYYQVKEFFRIQPKGKLWVGFFGVPSPYTFSEVTDMQNNAAGEIRQMLVFKDAVWAAADITSLNTIANANKTLYQPIQLLYAANLQATSDITTVTDLSTYTANNVMTVIGQDGGGWGNFLYKANGSGSLKSITCGGAQLGMASLRRVHESIGWVEKSNLSDGSEMEVPAFCNGQLVSALSNNALTAIDSKRYVFPMKLTGYQGTYFNGDNMAVSPSSDYAGLRDNRTICKAERLLYAAYVPKLNSPLVFNSNGTLADNTIAELEGIGYAALDSMTRIDPVAGGIAELSAKAVVINPSQNVVQTQTLVISVTLVANGIAKTIVIPIGYKPSL